MCATCTVYAAAGAGSAEGLEPTLDACSNYFRILPAPSMRQLEQVQADVKQGATPHDLGEIRSHYSRPVQEEQTQSTQPRQRCRRVDAMLS